MIRRTELPVNFAGFGQGLSPSLDFRVPYEGSNIREPLIIMDGICFFRAIL
jgi:hypothetical protein